MAAEKLTKKRIIQLLIALTILISAFLYRSCHYQPQTALQQPTTPAAESEPAKSE
ncbi:hypothetical protein ACUHGC_08900 [Testudinibacter sp. P27/CKL/0425]